MEIEYVSKLKKHDDTIDLYKSLEWYQLSGYTDEDIDKANESFYSVYAYDGDKLVGLGRVASDGMIVAVMSGICVRHDYRHHGIGAQIVERIVEYCQTGDYRLNVQLFCEDSLIKWYEGMGFEKLAVGMRKPVPTKEENSALKKNFSEIYGIEQITDACESFYWYNFDGYSDFSYYAGFGSEGAKVPFLRMIFYAHDPIHIKAEIIFENVSEFEIGCTGVRNPLFGFDIISTEKFGYADKKRYKIRSLEDDDISFFCEKFRIMNVEIRDNMVPLTPERPAEETFTYHENISDTAADSADALYAEDWGYEGDGSSQDSKPDTADVQEEGAVDLRSLLGANDDFDGDNAFSYHLESL